MASFAPGNFLLGQNLRNFFLLNFSDIRSWLKWSCSCNEMLWLWMCQSPYSTCSVQQVQPVLNALSLAVHTPTFFLVCGTQKDMTAQQRGDTAVTTALRQDESQTLSHTSVLWTPLFMTCLCNAQRLMHLEGNHRKRCAVFVQKLIIHVSQTP